MTPASESRMERVNLMLSREDSEWLDQLAAEILARSGAKVSRSEITRAALATLRELHGLAPMSRRFIPLEGCKSSAELGQMGVLAVRWATRE